MKALGMICGVGSMLIGAKEQGYDILGNIEWRKYYHTGTFEHNFPGSFMVNTIKDVPEDSDLSDLDLLIGHTECGGFSNLRAQNKNKFVETGCMGDIPEFIEAVQKFEPKFFVMDNLPKSLMSASIDYYMNELPDYDIHLEFVSNWGYGNVQKFRNRLFVIGAKKGLGYAFVPDEVNHDTTIRERIEGLDESVPNHNTLDPTKVYGGWTRYQFDPSYIPKSVDDNRLTLNCLQGFLRDEGNAPVGQSIFYYNKKGERKSKIGFAVINIDRHASVLSGGGACFDNHFRHDNFMPFTIRERARIQGCPDDFKFLPDGLTQTGPDYGKLIKQTGKFMPVEFCTFITGQIKDFLEQKLDPEKYTQERIIKPSLLINSQKEKFCDYQGYTNQKDACRFCSHYKSCNSINKQ